MADKPTLPAPYAEALLAHDGWLRALIRTLVDHQDVDDVAQETWLAAATRGGAPLASGRAWLGTVARRLAQRRRRSRARQQRREQAAARPEAMPATDELVQRVEARQRVTEIVLGLREPFRTTLLQRYYEQRSLREIAAGAGVPETTVRTRLHRGLGLVKARLAARDPDWRAALLAAELSLRGVAPASASAISLTGVLAMTTKGKVLLGGAILFGAAALPLWLAGGGDPVAGGVGVGGSATGEMQARVPSPLPAQAATAERVLAVEAEPAPVRPAASKGRSARGQVLDPRGQPLPEVDVWVRNALSAALPDGGGRHDDTVFAALSRGWTRVARTAADGAFEAVVEPGWLVVGPPFIALRPRHVGPEGGDGLVVVATRGVTVGGIVTDEAGGAVPGVRITGFCEGLPTFPASLAENGRPDFLGGRTNAQGVFHLERVPGAPEAQLTFAADGHTSVSISCPTTDRLDLRVTLPRHAAAASVTLRGHIYDPAGALLADARVGYGARQTTSDAQGAYELPVEALAAGEVLFATAPGYTAATRTLDPAVPVPIGLDLRLGPSDASVRGTLRRVDGEPYADAQIYLHDVRYLGASRFTRIGFEVGVDHDWIGPNATTDAAGRFAIRGVEARPWRLRILDRAAGFAMTTDPVPVNQDLELRVPADAIRAPIVGRVVDRAGRGVADVTVCPRIAVRMRDGHGVSTSGRAATTDAAGGFELTGVPRTSRQLSVSGPEVLATSHALDASGAGGDLVITVERPWQIRVLAPAAPAGAEVVALDGQGRALRILRPDEEGFVWNHSWQIENGETEVLTVPDSAVEIVLRHEGRELGRRRVAPQRDVLQLVF
ncbi:MAG: sigma-70 family RNA polymerase sigma factor [Planctomycetota bacterium]